MTGRFKVFRKPNNELLYVCKGSNHPQNVKNEIPLGINRMLNQYSSQQEDFQEVMQDYQDALSKCGYSDKLRYEKIDRSQGKGSKKRPRKKQITWFNPPWGDNVKTNLGKKFTDSDF